MNTRPLGKSGVSVSAIGLGCNALGGRIDDEASRRVIYKALDLGVTLFDTANSYGNRYGVTGGSEIALGKFLGPRRKDIVLATKFGTQSHKHAAIPVEGASRAEVKAAVEESLRRLRTDWIDLLQLHHPDPRTPVEETLRALDDLVREGKIRHAGCSNHPGWRVADADWTARHHGIRGYVTCQSEYSLLARGIEKEVLPALEHYGLGLLPCYPLAGGLLTGKYERHSMPAGARLTTEDRLANKYLTEENWSCVERLRPFAAMRGKSLLEVSIGWLLARPIVSSVIAGATRPEQVTTNVDAGACTLAPEELIEIETLVRGSHALRDSQAGAARATPVLVH